MGMKPLFDIEIFRNPVDNKVSPAERRRSMDAILWMMEGLCRINQGEIRLQKSLGKPFRPLYQSGIYYLREPPGQENWQDIYRNFMLGNGDCEDLACHRIAELREVYKTPAAPFVTFRLVDGSYRFHAILRAQTPNGWRWEDPSRKLGMGWEERFSATSPAERQRLIKKIDAVQIAVSKEMARSGMKKVGV
jgi:hypothetical protein